MVGGNRGHRRAHESYRASGPGAPPAAAAPSALAPGILWPGREMYPAGSTATERFGKKEGRDPILGDAFLQARLAPCRAAAIFQSLDWQPVAVSVLFPPRPNLKDEFNIYLLARELREAAGGRAATARGTSTPTPSHGVMPLMNECGERAEASPHLSSRSMLERPLCLPGTMGSG